jgi:hypothetical protein
MSFNKETVCCHGTNYIMDFESDKIVGHLANFHEGLFMKPGYKRLGTTTSPSQRYTNV